MPLLVAPSVAGTSTSSSGVRPGRSRRLTVSPVTPSVSSQLDAATSTASMWPASAQPGSNAGDSAGTAMWASIAGTAEWFHTSATVEVSASRSGAVGFELLGVWGSTIAQV